MRRSLSSVNQPPRILFAATAAALVLMLMPFRLALAGPVTTLAPVTEADGRLGLCNVLAGNPPKENALPWAQLAYNAGARVNRWEFRWDRLEPQANAWNYVADDAAVQSSQKYGLDVLGILIGTPRWGTASGQKPGNGVPKGLYLRYSDPKNLWATYVRQTVVHYGGQVHYWEVWNEPDLRFFWSGSPDDYFRLLKVAYLTIKEADPQAKVLVAGMVVPDLAFLRHVLDAARKDPAANKSHQFFDALAWHAYGPARDVYTNLIRLKALLSGKGFADRPLWVTEAGFPASNPNGEPRQAAYVLQSIAYALAAGASRVLVYRASDDPTPKTWGLLSASGDPRMGYVTFQIAARYLSHTRAIGYAPTPNLERFNLYQGNRHVLLLWHRGLADRAVRVPADNQLGAVVNWMGTSQDMISDGGQFHLLLSGAHYNLGVDPSGSVVGGPPQLVVQDDMPPANLNWASYLPPVLGGQRKVLIVNPSDAVLPVLLASMSNPAERLVLHVPPHGVRATDLDLLAGTAYGGMYVAYSPSPAVGEATSDRTRVSLTEPATRWYVPVAPREATVTNVLAKPIIARLSAFGPHGAVRVRQLMKLGAGSSLLWRRPVSLQGVPLALTVQASAPIVLSAQTAIRKAESTWYAVHPPLSHLSLFNPDPKIGLELDARFIGSRTVKGEQVRVAPRHSFSVSTHGAKVVVVSASRPLAAGYAGNRLAEDSLAPHGTTLNVVPASGPNTSVALFNPGAQGAHVTVSFSTGGRSRVFSRSLTPGQVSRLQLRKQSAPPGGASVSSDVPVVSVPSS